VIFAEGTIAGAFLVEMERREDARGYFARVFCEQEFESHGLPVRMRQASVSRNARAGTVRGMHFQWPPSVEAKLVRCERGRIFDVIVDLRPASPTYLQHLAIELSMDAATMLYMPAGVAHGFQTLVDDSVVHYQMTDFYAPRLADGVRWNDPAFGIRWPLPAAVIADRDRSYPDFDRAEHERRYRAAPAAGQVTS
jgi:dTDP-4-dehydrorhamnose 3,5-epimerase